MTARDEAARIRRAIARTQPLHLLLDTDDGRGLVWCRPGARLDELEWRARYAPASLTPTDIMALAEIANAYRTLIAKPAAQRDALVARMREHDDSARTEEP